MISLHPSAFKHDLDEESILAAMSTTAFVADLDDDSPARQLRLGFDRSGRLLELVVLLFDSGNELVIHAMRARPGYVQLLDRRS